MKCSPAKSCVTFFNASPACSPPVAGRCGFTRLNNIESREYNGRRATDIRAQCLQPAGVGRASARCSRTDYMLPIVENFPTYSLLACRLMIPCSKGFGRWLQAEGVGTVFNFGKVAHVTTKTEHLLKTPNPNHPHQSCPVPGRDFKAREAKLWSNWWKVSFQLFTFDKLTRNPSLLGRYCAAGYCMPSLEGDSCDPTFLSLL